MTITAALLLLFLVMDPIGNIPFIPAALKNVERRRWNIIIFREHLIALGVLVAFLFGGRYFLSFFQIQEPSLSIAGGIILFLIAINMIFKPQNDIFGQHEGGEPFVVPLAIPYVAGPSTLATLLLLSTREPARWADWLLALSGAWVGSLIVLLLAGTFIRLLGPKVLSALETLMGMFLTAVAVQMFITGLSKFIVTF
jgi:MarC family membrane protein